MLNLFPIQWLALFAYAFLRLFVAGVLLFLGFKHFRYRHELKDILVLSWWPFGQLSTFFLILGELVLGCLFLFGAFTQIAALGVILMCLEMLVFRNYWQHASLPPKIFYVLLLGASLSLFITGAGVLAVDLPI